MKIRLLSDLHTEFLGPMFNIMDEHLLRHVLPPLPDDKETVLVLAGDIGSRHKPKFFLAAMKHFSSRFKQVFMIPGNHEYYGGSLRTTDLEILQELKEFRNVTFTPKGIFGFEGKRFVMATLWADFEGQNEEVMDICHYGMNDYNLIEGPQQGMRAHPQDTLALHLDTVKFFEDEMQQGDIVITHHLPSFNSVPQQYRAGKYSQLNGAYYTNLEDLMKRKKPRLWMHGHTHDSCTYLVGETIVFCNPVGYRTELNRSYNKELVLQI